jgi:hypothetical protein
MATRRTQASGASWSRLLHDLIGLVQVTGHREQDAEQPADGGRVELLESLGVGHVLGFRVGKV